MISNFVRQRKFDILFSSILKLNYLLIVNIYIYIYKLVNAYNLLLKKGRIINNNKL